MNKQYLESIKIVDGKIFHLQWHQLRLNKVLKSINSSIEHSLLASIHPPKYGHYRCRVIYSKDSIFCEYIPYVYKDIFTLKLVYKNTIEYTSKYLDRKDLDTLYSLREECDDILIIKNSHITDTSIANVAFFDGKRWITPKYPLLQGTTRARLLYEKKIIEKEIHVNDIEKFSRVALMNAMRDFDIIRQENIRDIIC